MLFQPIATITELWAYVSCASCTKRKSVSPRGFYSLTFRRAGKVQIEHEGNLYVSESNSVTFMPKGVAYRTQVLAPSETLTIHFSVSGDYPGLTPWSIRVKDSEKFHTLFVELVEKYRSAETMTYGCIALACRILEELDAELSPAASRSLPPRVRRAKAQMDENFSEDLSVSAMAAAAGVSEAYFRGEFRKYLGVSPAVYLKNVRIEHAKALLRSGCLSITDVAVRCGFNSVSWFSCEFRRITGISPSVYMKNMAAEGL